MISGSSLTVLLIKKSNFLVIGAASRNVGKTEFACRLINRYKDDFQIIGVKITPVNREEGVCQRGNKNCRVCSTLVGDYCIIEEKDPTADKDTSRMLKAGARKVFWLKTDKKYLEVGLTALLKKIPQHSLVVCESNSIRLVMDPALFLIIKKKGETAIKSSCEKVIKFADRIITFHKMDWNISPERILIKDHQWIIKEQATAIVLAGGKSSRMGGTDKSLIIVNDMPMIEHIVNQLKDHFDQILISANEPEKYSFLNLNIVKDKYRDIGPLAGILACVKESRNKINFITACDVPNLNLGLIHHMIKLSTGVDIVMPVTKDFMYEPLFAVYKKTVINHAENIIDNNGRRIIELLKYVKTRFVPLNDSNWYHNINTKEDYSKFKSEIKKRRI